MYKNPSKSNTEFLLNWAKETQVITVPQGPVYVIRTKDQRHSITAPSRIIGLYRLWNDLHAEKPRDDYFK